MPQRKTSKFLVRFLLRILESKKYVELEKFKSVICYETELERYLNEFQKPGTKHNLSLNNFFLYYSYGYCSTDFDRVYSDAQYALVLTYKERGADRDEEVACIGFEVVSRSSILVKQIQGVSGKLPVLQYFRWEKMLLKIVMDWAKNVGFKSVRVIQAKSSDWYRDDRHQNFFMKYDITARRSGFKFDEKDQTYVRTLA